MVLHKTVNQIIIMSTNQAKQLKLENGKQFHVLFLYRNDYPDKNWVEEVVEVLESEAYGFKCCLPHRDFTLGERLIDNVARSMNKSMRCVVVLSNSYLDSEWCLFEAHHFLTPKVKIVPVKLDSCSTPSNLETFGCLEVAGKRNVWWKRFLNELTIPAPLLPNFKTDHVFFYHSGNSEEKAWVEDVTKRLESQQFGFRCITSHNCLVSRKKVSLRACLGRVLTAVLVLSKEFLKQEWSKCEEEIYGSGVNVVPVLLSSCEVPVRLKEGELVDATNKSSRWWQQLLYLLTNPHTGPEAEDDNQPFSDDTDIDTVVMRKSSRVMAEESSEASERRISGLEADPSDILQMRRNLRHVLTVRKSSSEYGSSLFEHDRNKKDTTKEDTKMRRGGLMADVTE